MLRAKKDTKLWRLNKKVESESIRGIKDGTVLIIDTSLQKYVFLQVFPWFLHRDQH